MKIIIDGYENLVMPEENETLGELLIQLDDWIRKNKRIIIQIKLEGKDLSEIDKNSIFNKKADEFKILEVFTADLWNWAICSLEKMKMDLPEIAKGLKKVSDFIQKGNWKKAFFLFDGYIRLWDEINQTLEMIRKAFALDYSQIFLNEEVSYKADEFIQLLKEAKRAMNENDFLTLADILEYELAPRLEGEKRFVEEVANLLKHQMN